jgi:RND family efflux transporter MFP subunit
VWLRIFFIHSLRIHRLDMHEIYCCDFSPFDLKCSLASMTAGARLLRVSAMAFFLTFLCVGCAKNAPQSAPAVPAPEVMVFDFQTRTMPEYLEVTGRINSVFVVDIRSRVGGYLSKIFFRDGQFVRKGDPLYEIDPRPSLAKLAESKGTVEKLLGERRFAEIQIARYEKLISKGAASQQELDAFRAKLEENTGSLTSARAQQEFNQLNLDFCTIVSPIDGQVSRTQFQIGNLINQDQTTLTTVVSIDPIFVYFNVDEPNLVRVLKTTRSTSRSNGIFTGQLFIDVGLVDDLERAYPHRCVVDFLNNQLDTQTATITMRGRLDNPHDPNPDHPKPPLFRSGMFARVRLPLGQPAQRLLVPETAIASNQDRKILWVVDTENVASTREVLVGQKVGTWITVQPTDPSKPFGTSDRVVVRGLQRCREGKPVTPKLASAEIVLLNTLPIGEAAIPDDTRPDDP